MPVNRLKELYKILRKNQNGRKRVTMIGYNHLYAEIADDDLVYFNDNIFPKLESFFSGKTWCNSKAELEREVQIYFNEIISSKDEMEIFKNTLDVLKQTRREKNKALSGHVRHINHI